MSRQKLYLLSAVLASFVIPLGCAVTSHRATPTDKGTKLTREKLAVKSGEKGPIRFEKISTVEGWSVDRSGLINLKDPKAQAAGLKKGDEPTEIFFYVLEHPQYGTYLIDTGISDVFRKDRKEWPVNSMVANALNFDKLTINVTAGEWLKKRGKNPDGIFLTHIHLDHIMGAGDFPRTVPVYMGPTESKNRGFLNMFVQGSTDGLLGETPNIRELVFSGDADQPGVIDFFGDSSLFIFWVPGHTDGSLAYLIKTTTGLELVLGDTCHTRWGWENDVTPGSYTSDAKKNRESLDYLQSLAKSLPGLRVHPGHQR